jgi:DNA repair protein RecO (recombination protein O)
MPTEKATALVLRTTDWSESSRICTLWTREMGKVRALAKGGRRLKSSFDNALDLLTVCGIVLLRKPSGGLDLLTEASASRRFPRLQKDLTALYAGYYVAELLADWTEDLDPHPALFDEAVAALGDFGGEVPVARRLLRFEACFLAELGYHPVLEACASCGAELPEAGLAYSPEAGGAVCTLCQRRPDPSRRPMSALALSAMRRLFGEEWNEPLAGAASSELRHLMGHQITHLRGRPPRLLPYLGGES